MKSIFIKEFQINLQSGRLATTFLLLVLAFLVSLGMMFQQYRERVDQYNLSISGGGKDWLIETVWSYPLPDGRVNSSAIGTFPMGKIKSPQPLSYFARGVDPEFGRPVEYFTHFDNARIHVYPNHKQNLFELAFDPPDLLTVVTILLSLLAMLFSYGLFCREKEKGTLKQMLAAGASRTSIFGGKFRGGLASLWLCFTGAFLVYLIALSFIEPRIMAGGLTARIAVVYLTCVLFAFVFYSLGALISALSRSSSTSIVLAFFVWLLLIFIIPGTTAMLAQQFAPVPSRQEIERQKLDAMQQIQEDYAAEHPDERPWYRDGVQIFNATLEDVNKSDQRIEEEYERLRERRNTLTLGLSRVSPVSSANNIITALSLNGLDDLKRYKADRLNLLQGIRDQLEKYTDYIRRTYPSWAVFGRTPEEQGEIQKVFDVQAGFRYSSLTLGESMNALWLDFALLAGYALLALAVSFIRFLKYDPR